MVLAVGSANPSYPAWLAPGITKNIEMMIARKGEDVKEAAEELGLTAIASMPPLSDEEWAAAKDNWDRKDESEQNDAAVQIFMALVTDEKIRFRLPGIMLPPVIDCEVIDSVEDQADTRQAHLAGSEYILSNNGKNASASFVRFKLDDKRFIGLIQHVKQIEGLSRTSSQRKFNEALASLATDMPNLEHFVECIKDIIKIGEKVVITRTSQGLNQRTKGDKRVADPVGGAELSIGRDEIVVQDHSRKRRLRNSDDLGYLLDKLLYSLRDEDPIGLDVVMEERQRPFRRRASRCG